ncbi:MAG: NAD-binding protein, partial [Candidatus Pacebacteria bacterium]|nr:NAD-binding protein [Candidatus Paceibacterota bacterium]
LLFVGAQAGYVVGNEIAVFTLVALTTILISSYLILYNEEIYKFLLPFFNFFGKDKNREQVKEMEELFEVWVVGYHRIGASICEVLKEKKKKFAVIDFDPEAIKKLRISKIKSIFGDIADIEFLEDLKFKNTKLVIMTIPSTDDQINFISHLKNIKSNSLIIANAYHRSDAQILYKAGANYVMMPHFLGGKWVASMLKKNAWNRKNFSLLKKEQKNEIKYNSNEISDKLVLT